MVVAMGKKESFFLYSVVLLAISLMGRVFANGLEDQGSNPG